jgi:transcription initiation factor IIE alpha subunit
MIDESMFDAVKLLDDHRVRRIFEYLLKNMAASELKMSYDLKMAPDELTPSLAKLLEIGLVQTVTTQGTLSQSYTLTEKGFRMNRYLSGPSYRQFKR